MGSGMRVNNLIRIVSNGDLPRVLVHGRTTNAPPPGVRRLAKMQVNRVGPQDANWRSQSLRAAVRLRAV